jgi:P27 family predicted phage terminase small subunit
MAGRGRLTPIEQRIREGNPAKRPLPEVVLVGGRPVGEELQTPPDMLPIEAKHFWRSTVSRLIEVGMLDVVDEPSLILLATQYARILQAGAVVAAEGFIVEGSQGQPREHPALKTEREATRLFHVLAGQFGLTPVARTRMGLAELHRRSLESEVSNALGEPDLRPVDAEVVDDV